MPKNILTLKCGAERTRRWLDQLPVPAIGVTESESRRPVSFTSGGGGGGISGGGGGPSGGAVTGLASRHAGRAGKQGGSSPISGIPHRDRPEFVKKRCKPRAKSGGLFSCLTCTSTLD